MAYYKDVDAKRKKKEQQAVQWFGAKTQTPATTVLTKSDFTQNSGTKTGGALKNVFQGLKNAVVQSAELQSSNQNLIAQNTGATVKKAAQTTLGNLGQAASAYSQAQTTSANLNSALAKSAAKTTLGNLGQAASAYSQAQTTSANLNSVLAKSAGKTVTSNAAALYGAQANAQRATANATIQGAKDLSGQYGETWGMTTGVTGSDQTGASLWGYWNSENQTGRNAESEREKAERIREHIADGGADAVLYGIGARAMSGMKSLEGYNKLLQYSATGKIHDDPTVTPGTYSKIVDEAIAKKLESKYGPSMGDNYLNMVSVFDDVLSSVVLGPGLNMIKSYFDEVDASLDESKQMGRNDLEAFNRAIVKGTSDALGGLTAGGINEIRKKSNSSVPIIIEEAMNKIPESIKNSMEAAVVSGGSAVIEDIILGLIEKGFSWEQSNKILGYELDKTKRYGRDITVGALQSIAERLLK